MHLPIPRLYGGAPAGAMRARAATAGAGVVPALDPPGNCSWARHNQLMDAVNAHCRNLSRCEGWMNEDQLFARIRAFINCYTARDQINDECFAGGDAGHRQAADNAFRGRELCNEYWVAR
ncbi:MAG TPA: hypothetical protein VF092_23540 [Longimicrobium sp.]